MKNERKRRGHLTVHDGGREHSDVSPGPRIISPVVSRPEHNEFERSPEDAEEVEVANEQFATLRAILISQRYGKD